MSSEQAIFPRDVSPAWEYMVPLSHDSSAEVKHLQDALLLANATHTAKHERLEGELDDVYARLESATRQLATVHEEYAAREASDRSRPQHRNKVDSHARPAEPGWHGQRQTLLRTIGDLDGSLQSITAERDALAASLQSLRHTHAKVLAQHRAETDEHNAEREGLETRLLAAEQRVTQLVQQQSLANRTTIDLTRDNEDSRRKDEEVWKERYEAVVRVSQTLKAEIVAHAGEIRALEERLESATPRDSTRDVLDSAALGRGFVDCGVQTSPPPTDVNLPNPLHPSRASPSSAVVLSDAQPGLHTALKTAKQARLALQFEKTSLERKVTDLERTAAEQRVELERFAKEKRELEEMVQLELGVSRDLRMEVERISKEATSAESPLQETRAALEKTSADLRAAQDAEKRMKVLFTELNKRATDAGEKVNALQREMDAYRKDAERSLEAEKKRTHALRELLGRTVEDLEASRAAHETTKDTLRTAEGDLLAARRNEETLRSEIATLETTAKERELASFRKQQTAHDRQVAKYVAEINRLKADLEGRDAFGKGSEGGAELLRADVARLEGCAKEEKRKRDAGEERIRDLEDELDTADETVDELREQVSVLETAAASTEEQVAALREEKEERDRQIAAYVSDAAKLERDLAERDTRIKQSEGEVARLSAEIDSATKSLAEARAEKERACTTINDLSGQLEQAMTRQPSIPDDSLAKDLETLRAQLVAAEEDAKIWKSDAGSLQEWLGREISQNEQAKKKSEAMAKKLDEMSQERLDLMTKLAAMEEENRNARASAEGLAAEQSVAAGLKEDNSALQEQIQALKTEIDTSRSQAKTAPSNPPTTEALSVAQPFAAISTETKIPSPLFGAAVSNKAVVSNDPAVSINSPASQSPTGRPLVKMKIMGAGKGVKPSTIVPERPRPLILRSKANELTDETFATIGNFLAGANAFGSLASMNVANRALHLATIPGLYETMVLDGPGRRNGVKGAGVKPSSNWNYTKYLFIDEHNLDVLQSLSPAPAPLTPAERIASLFPHVRFHLQWKPWSCLDPADREDATLEIHGRVGAATLHSLLSTVRVRCLSTSRTRHSSQMRPIETISSVRCRGRGQITGSATSAGIRYRNTALPKVTVQFDDVESRLQPSATLDATMSLLFSDVTSPRIRSLGSAVPLSRPGPVDLHFVGVRAHLVQEWLRALDHTVTHAINDLTVHMQVIKSDKWSLSFARIEELFTMAVELYTHRWSDIPLSRRIVEQDGASAAMFRLEARTFEGIPVTGMIEAVPGTGGDSIRSQLDAVAEMGEGQRYRSSVYPRVEITY